MGQPRSIKSEGDIRTGYNNTGTDIAAHVFVMLDSTSGQIKLPSGTTIPLYGVTLTAIKDKTRGDIQVRGLATVKAHGALATPGVQLKTDTAGKVDAWSAAGGTNCHNAGLLGTTAGGADELVEVELAGPGIIQQG